MDETTSAGVETDTDDSCECACAGEDTEGTCTESDRGCAVAPTSPGWSPELLGVFLVLALRRRRFRTSSR